MFKFTNSKKLPLWVKNSYPIAQLFFFSISPILYLFSNNTDQATVKELVFPIILSLSFSLLLFRAALYTLGKIKAALFVSLFNILFFSYGHLKTSLGEIRLTLNFSKDEILLPIFVLTLLSAFFFLWKSKKALAPLAKLISNLGLLLIIFALFNTFSTSLKNGFPKWEEKEPTSASELKTRVSNQPDIYYLILDGYANEKILKSGYKFDNASFLDSLSNRGFYIAHDSRSNYPLTLLSLSSSMNMNYLDFIDDKNLTDQEKRRKAYLGIRNGELPKFLKAMGYTFLDIGTGWVGTDHNQYAHEVIKYPQRTEFIKLLFSTSALTLIERYQNDAAKSILYAFDQIEKISKRKESTFTFAHIISPHPPYLFDEAGNILAQPEKDIGVFKLWKQKDSYISQLKFINKKVLSLVEQILKNSPQPPLIVIQSDHGPTTMDQFFLPLESLTEEQTNERFGILNAYYLPAGGQRQLTQTISPVNSFRKILNFYFGGNFKTLEDKHYFTGYSDFQEAVKFD